MMEHYKEEIIKMLESIGDEKYMRYIYILLSEMIVKS